MSPDEAATVSPLVAPGAPVIEQPPAVASTTREALPYTGVPFWLFVSDVKLFFRNLRYLPWIFLPLRTSSLSAELYPNRSNLIDIAFHSTLFVTQLGFIVSLVTLAFLPTWLYLGYITVFFLINELICSHFNIFIPPTGLKSSEDYYSRNWKKHPDEAWIFLNGICVGSNWFQKNVDRISRTFHRPVVGIHNRTAGVIFDLVQCLIQRSFNYATQDVRDCYLLVKDALLDDKKKKVILILHSQGGIEGGMILDWLLDELPHEKLKRLEIYTFGNLANHFSNPARAKDPVTEKEVPAIQHMEHYANSKDFACRFGVLHFTKHLKKKNWATRFMGDVYVNQRGGHQLNQHYLDGMFPMDPSGQFVREPLEHDFMNTEAQVKPPKDGVPPRIVKGKTAKEAKRTAVNPNTILVVDKIEVQKIKDRSRLWMYRNGGTPEEEEKRRAEAAAKKAEEEKAAAEKKDGKGEVEGQKQTNDPEKDVNGQKKDVDVEKKDEIDPSIENMLSQIGE